MSFDLFYQPSHFGSEPVEWENAFTGEVQSQLPVLPLSVEDRAKVREILAKADAGGPSDSGCYMVHFDDGGAAERFASDIGTGCMAAFRGLSADLLRFLFDVLGSANCVLLPATAGNPAIISAPGLANGFPSITLSRPIGAVPEASP